MQVSEPLVLPLARWRRPYQSQTLIFVQLACYQTKSGCCVKVENQPARLQIPLEIYLGCSSTEYQSYLFHENFNCCRGKICPRFSLILDCLIKLQWVACFFPTLILCHSGYTTVYHNDVFASFIMDHSFHSVSGISGWQAGVSCMSALPGSVTPSQHVQNRAALSKLTLVVAISANMSDTVAFYLSVLPKIDFNAF